MKKISLAILTLLVALTACKKVPEVNLKYVDVERDLITVGTTSATVQCDYQYIATLKKAYLYYGEGENETDMNAAEMCVVQNTLYVDLTGLKENATYSYYYEFHNGFNSMRTVVKTFKTETGNGGGEEPPTPPEIMLPTVITAEVTEITTNSAQCGGEVVNDGGTEVTERGICWGTNENPTLNDNHVAVGSGTGTFTAMMNGLEANTTYHVRAYATNEAGTVYGLDKEFATLSGGGSGNAPVGAIDGLFTINENGDQVYFSKGNLQYQASTNTWRFAENQYDLLVKSEDMTDVDYFGNMYADVSSQYSSANNGWIDLFGWGTSGYNHGAICYQPWSTIGECSDYYAYGSYTYNLYDQTGQADWGYNPISNGGNQANQWRTFTNAEWGYVLFTRTTLSGIRYVKANVNNVNGLILLPDDWNESTYTLNNTNNSEVSFGSNTITASRWTTLENAGAVFLPAAGNRGGSWLSSVYYVGSRGFYWSANYSNSSSAYLVDFDDSHIDEDYPYFTRNGGRSVRLVQDTN